jgi:hypothetical protein
VTNPADAVGDSLRLVADVQEADAQHQVLRPCFDVGR